MVRPHLPRTAESMSYRLAWLLVPLLILATVYAVFTRTWLAEDEARQEQLTALNRATDAFYDETFSDDGEDKAAPGAQLLKDILSAGAQAVAFGEQDLGEDPEKAKNIAFASDGMDVDQDDLATHQKALAYQSQNPGTDYLAAVQAVKEA